MATAFQLGTYPCIWQKVHVATKENAKTVTPSWRLPPESANPQNRGLDVAVIFALSMVGLVSLILWFGNAQGITGNGVFKAVTIKGWVADPTGAPLDHSNYLYYPAMALLCRLLDLFGAYPGDPRHQLTLINAFSASVCLCIVYVLVREITGRRSVAWAVSFFHLSGAFFLNLAIINEDIMPSYTLMFASMALASIWFVHPTPAKIAVVAIFFTVAWMFEWRLMFPTLPAMVAALALSPGRALHRCYRVVLFVGTMVGVAQVTVWLWGPHNNNVGPVFDLLWTGKGVGEGWAGFSIPKISLLWAGITQYLVGGANIGDISFLPLIRSEMVATTIFIVIVGVLSLTILWRNHKKAEARVLAAIFGITFAAGEVMNLYSQPQDPQMQINVMVWLTLGWTLILAVGVQWHHNLVLGTSIALSFALLAYNVSQLIPRRGADDTWRLALERIEQEVDPSRTIFLLHGFEEVVSEKFYKWDGDWDYFKKLGPAPASKPKFKLLALVSGPVHKPNASGAELANDLRAQIERSLDLGYSVVANVVWKWTEAQLESSLVTVADSEKAKALYEMLHENFTASQILSDPVAGPYFRLQRR